LEKGVVWEGEGEENKTALTQAGSNGSVMRLEPVQSAVFRYN